MNLTCYFLFTCFSFLFAAQVINLPTIQNVNLEEFPYQAQIVTSEETACSAIIISRNYIMTPATCIAESSSVKVYVGTKTKAKHLSKNILNTYGYNSSNFLFNGDDNTFWNFKYDIALIRIPQPLEFSAVIQKAKIKWDDVLLKENSMLQVSGWSNSDATFDLKKMEVKLAPEILCDYCYNAGETQKIISCFKQPGRLSWPVIQNIKAKF
ncbi:hypothetical protein GWI33_001037 [Rhynchophorus ferrugineus]|uniref:Peptidase S1 domain-containing protein n=1 Tax=Rhynchophorus ferrugineus TaxID=354439 RepID=A0A834HQB5_RHYFE|nr:hypothetical protein GWI33_001037 [Rhynchophorus ferrugineus]